MRKRTGKRWQGALIPLVLISATAAAGEVVIGNRGIKIDALTQQQVSDLYLRKLTQLPDGTKIIVFDHKDEEPIKDEFYGRVLNMTPSQLKAYWAKATFTDQSYPPIAYKGDEAVKRLVANTPGGIGYINDKSADGTVKILFKP